MSIVHNGRTCKGSKWAKTNSLIGDGKYHCDVGEESRQRRSNIPRREFSLLDVQKAIYLYSQTLLTFLRKNKINNHS